MLPNMSETLFNLGHNEILGRYAKASRDIRPGELILKEKSVFIGGPINGVHQCFKCNVKLIKDVYVCGRCHVATICCKECKGVNHPRTECDALKSSKLQAGDIVKNPQIVMAVRCLLTREYNEEAWNDFMQLESHLDIRKNTPIWTLHENNIVKVLKDIGLPTEDDLIQKICGILDVNTFEVRQVDTYSNEMETMRGLYLKAALMAHDCIGNTFLAVDEDYILTIHAASFIKEGEPIYFNYANSFMNTQERRNYLKEGKYFDCTCKRCKDPSELGTYMSSILCQKCKTGVVAINNPLDNNSFWDCNQCSEKTTGKLVETIIQGCRNYMNLEGVDTPTKIENVLQKFESYLTPKHSIILDLKQTLISMYENDKLSVKSFERKLELCYELVEVLKLIEPDISRLTAIALHELSTTKINYADYLLNNQDINETNYLKIMEEAELLLKDCIKILIYEPQKSPEGRLLQQALLEMKAVRRSIQEITNLTKS